MTMPETTRTELRADYEKLRGFALKPGKTGMDVRHSQAGAVGAMGFLVLFAGQQGENVGDMFKDHDGVKDVVDRIFDLEWVSVGGSVSAAAERRNCEMYIGYNLHLEEYRKSYP